MIKPSLNKITFFLMLLGMSVGLLGQTKAIDYTQANKSFEKMAPKPEDSRLSQEKFVDKDKKFDSKKFVPSDNTEHLQNKKFLGPENPNAERFFKKQFEGGKEKFKSPDLENFNTEKKQREIFKFDNSDRNFDKEYSGKIDFEKRNKFSNKLKEAYTQMRERSMQDINKYNFRSSHSSEDGMQVVSAGKQLYADKDYEGTSGIEDFIFGRKKLERAPVSFKKNMSLGSTRDSTAPNADNQNNIDANQNALSGNAKNQFNLPAGGGSRELPAKFVGEAQKSPNKPEEKMIKIMETEVQDKVLFKPNKDGVRAGKIKITVEVEDPNK